MRRGNDIELGPIVGARKSLLLSENQRQNHLHVVGATGVGKSKFLEHLVRQDIRNHYRSGCGLMLIDRHGSLFDGIVEWLTGYDPEAELPVVLIDLRQDEWIIAYNPLRKREADASVIANNVIESISHVWGAEGTTNTPLFAYVGRLVTRTLYTHQLSICEATSLLQPANSPLREAIADRAVGPDREKWRFYESLRPAERFAEFRSSINRFDAFVNNPLLRAMLGQNAVSLDLGRAINRGYIILVAAASKNAKISDEDARVFATLLLSDLWTAAKERGKSQSSASKDVRPFYLYLDEFQEFVTPTIAKSLDQSRGFGLHLVLAHQFPGQLRNAGAHGQQLYDSVMENGRNKVAFHLSYDLEEITRSLFLGTFNVDEVKHELWSTKVIGQHEEQRTSYARNETSGKNLGSSRTIAKRRTDEYDDGEETGRLTDAENMIEIDTATEGEVESTVMIQDFEKELSGIQFRSIEEQLVRAQRVLFDQLQRQCMVRLAESRVPVALLTPTVTNRPVSAKDVRRYVSRRLKKWKFALTAREAAEQLGRKNQEIQERILQRGSGEPTVLRRRIK